MILHGYGGNALQMAEYALYFREHYGFNILLPDMRCHGQSDGRYLGMGWLERKDCLQWLALLEKKLGPGVQAALYGVSMGGATVMMLAGEALPPWVKFMVEDCGYTSVHDQFAFQVKSIYHLPPFPIVPLGSLLCRALAGYGFWEASAVKQLQKATLPMVFVHGQADTFVPYAMLQTVFEQAACQNKVRIAIPGATHAQAFPMDTVGKIKKEIDRYIRLYM